MKFKTINATESLDRIQKRLADMPRDYRQNYLKALNGNSLRAAVKAQCLECMMWKRDEVRDCSSYCCPLHAVRPFQSPQNTHESRIKDTEAAITEEVAV